MENVSLAERVSQEIARHIRSEQLTTGNTLPSARRLAETYGTTLPTVREALRMLESTGMVELRHGSGTYVGPSVGKPFLVNPYVAEGTIESALELTEARLIIEPEVAAVAARERSDAALAKLEGTLGNALNPETEASGSHFHIALAEATGQTILTEVVDTMLRLRLHDRHVIRATYSDRDRDHAEHRDILDAVRDGDANAARALTAAHLTHIRNHLRQARKEVR
ncbi:FadR/GntR family transcriptional regulator [Mariniluteicoccus flavus]